MAQRLTFFAIDVLVVACAQDAPSSATDQAAQQLYPDVTEASLTQDSDGTFTASATMSSPYDSPQRYADAWRVLTAEREELAVRVLTHDHAGEQPFTRSKSGIAIPDDVNQVIVQGRDLVNGWGGAEITVDLMR
ncbi:hypothetical protein BH24ACT15_BH24ACT15_07080 [soil metagenome]